MEAPESPDSSLSDRPSPIDPADHIGLVVTIARCYIRPGEDVRNSEAFGDGMLGLVLAAAEITPGRLDEFPAYAAASIRHAITRGRARGKTLIPFTDVGHDSRDDDGFAAAIPDRDGRTALEDVEDVDLVRNLLGCLDDRERRLVERVVMQGWSQQEAGRAEPRPVTPQRVCQIVSGAVAKMQRVAGRRGGPMLPLDGRTDE